MALAASRCEVRAQQWKARFVVIECRWFPGAGRVARGTIAGEITRRMVGICRALVIALMARETVRWRVREAIVRMALIACNSQMCAGEWKACAVVIKSGIRPSGNRAAVAGLASQ